MKLRNGLRPVRRAEPRTEHEAKSGDLYRLASTGNEERNLGRSQVGRIEGEDFILIFLIFSLMKNPYMIFQNQWNYDLGHPMWKS